MDLKVTFSTASVILKKETSTLDVEFKVKVTPSPPSLPPTEREQVENYTL